MDSILHEDLASIEDITPFLKQCVGKGKEIPPGSILQVQQITNISFPTYEKPNYDNEKHTLKLTVTDGNSQGYALIPDGCPGISLNTAPGTKIRISQPVPVQGSLFVLTRHNCEVLGGRVVKLVEKWEQQKKLAIKHDWGYTGSSVEGEGPPAWKPFGYKPSIDVAALRKMKASDIVNEKKDGQPGGIKSQFDMQRDEAISELQGTANKQKFQKPNKHLLDKEITDIMDEGFSQTDAEYAMKRFKNPQKALKFLKESKIRSDGKEVPKPPPVERKDRRRKGKGMDDDEEQDVPVEYRCPTKSTSLFAFIESQIKTDTDKPSQTNGPTSRGQGDNRSRDLEDGMGRLNIKESSESYSSYNRSDRGRGGRGYRGSGGRGGGITRDSYPPQQRYENKREAPPPPPPAKNEVSQKPPRFQNRSGPESRSTDYHHGSQRNQSNSNYDNYRGHNRDSYDTGVSRPTYTENSRQDNTSNYQSQQQHQQQQHQQQQQHHQQQQHQQQQQQQQQQQHQQHQRLPTGKDRSYSSEYYPQQQQYSSQQQSNDYPVPSQNYQQQHSYQQQQQQQHQQQPPRQYMNASGQNQEYGNHRGGSQHQQRPQSHYPPPSSGGGHNQPPHPEFKQYQYGYEGWNPAQSLVFTRSKPDSRGRGGYQGGGRGATSHSAGRTYANRY